MKKVLLFTILVLILSGCSNNIAENRPEIAINELSETSKELRRVVFSLGYKLGSSGVSREKAMKTFDIIENGGTPDDALKMLKEN